MPYKISKSRPNLSSDSSSVKTLPITDSSYWTRQITFCAPFNDKFLFRENYDECKPIKEH